ncbi:MAG: GDP-mannose 4,6-dehydratase [Armatimonadetes bacterium]|nr:GDP-mannose 4,6-dehydratase [Armatimonadota bacterium]
MSAYWLGRSVLVTGASGLLGGWLTPRLIELGARPVCLIRDQVPECELVRRGTIARVRVVHGDLLDSDLLARTVAEYEVDLVIHLAAQSIVGTARRNPAATFEANIGGTWRLLEAVRTVRPETPVVVASSDKAYGSQAALPYDESMPLRGEYPYDVSKSCADLIARSYALTYGLRTGITRCGNLFGGGDLNNNRIVPGTITSVLRGERPIIRSDGQFVRDFMYVEDAVAAYLLLAEKLAASADLAGEAFNISYEQPLTVLELVARILDQMGSDLEPDVRNEASAEIREEYLSAAKAREHLGWRPEHSLDEGLARTIAWYASETVSGTVSARGNGP